MTESVYYKPVMAYTVAHKNKRQNVKLQMIPKCNALLNIRTAMAMLLKSYA